MVEPRRIGRLQHGCLVVGEADREGCHGVVNMLCFQRTHDRRRHHRIPTQPGQRNHWPGDAPFFRNRPHRIDNQLVAVGRGCSQLVGRFAFRPCGGHAPRPGQPATVERTVDDGLHPFVDAERMHLALFLAVEKIVAILHRHEAGPAVGFLQV